MNNKTNTPLNLEGNTKKPLRLIKWANDKYPPINMDKEWGSVIELINGYEKLLKENEQLNRVLNDNVEERERLRKELAKSLIENEQLKEQVRVLREALIKAKTKVIDTKKAHRVYDCRAYAMEAQNIISKALSNTETL